MSTQASFGEKYEAEAGKKLKEEAIREEQRILRDIEKKFKQDDEKERLKVENRRKELLRSQEVNKNLDEMKRTAKEREKANDLQLKIKYENDNMLESKKMQIQTQEKMIKIKQTRDALDAQVLMKTNSKRNEASLTPLEISLNKVNTFLF
jgi:hypothetical protein